MSILTNSARQDNQSKKHVNDFRRVNSAGRHGLETCQHNAAIILVLLQIYGKPQPCS